MSVGTEGFFACAVTLVVFEQVLKFNFNYTFSLDVCIVSRPNLSDLRLPFPCVTTL